jgi:hypothetical protein
VKRLVAAPRTAKPGASYTMRVPASKITRTPLENKTYGDHGEFRGNVPVDDRLFEYAKRKSRVPDRLSKFEAIQVCRQFPTNASYALLDRLLEDPLSEWTWEMPGDKLRAFRDFTVRGYAYSALKDMGRDPKPPITKDPVDANAQVVVVQLDPSACSPEKANELAKLPNLRKVIAVNGSLQPGFLAKLSKVESLYLEGSSLTDQDLLALAGARRLAYLNVANTKITDDSVSAIADLKSLKTLDVGSNLSAAGVEKLRKRRPDIKIHGDDLAFLAVLRPRRVDVPIISPSVDSVPGAKDETWRYYLVFPKEFAQQATELLQSHLSSWQPGFRAHPEFGAGYHRYLSKLTGGVAGQEVDSIMTVNEAVWGIAGSGQVSLGPGGFAIMVERGQEW